MQNKLYAFYIYLIFFFLLLTQSNIFAEEKKTLTLKECVTIALNNHPDLKVSEGYVAVAKTKVTQALSGWYPQVTSLSNLYTYTYQQSQSANSPNFQSLVPNTLLSNLPTLGQSSGDIKYDYYTSGITLNQLIYDFGKTTSNARSAKEGLNAAQYDLLVKRFEIVFNAKQAFFQAIAARKTLEAKQEAVIKQQEHLDQAISFFTEGTKAKNDLTKAEVDLAKAQLDLIKAENSWKKALAKLANTMGIKNETAYEIEDPLIVKKVEFDLKTAYEEAENQRPELKKFSANIRSYKAKKKAAEVQNLPALSGIAAYNWQGQQLPLPYYYNYGMQVSFTLSDGHNASALAQEAEGNMKINEAQKASKLQDIRLEVEKNYLDLLEAEERVRVSEKTLSQAIENFDIAKGRYNVGLGTGLEFHDARVSLTEAKTDYISALTDYQIAKAGVEKALGLFLEN